MRQTVLIRWALSDPGSLILAGQGGKSRKNCSPKENTGKGKEEASRKRIDTRCFFPGPWLSTEINRKCHKFQPSFWGANWRNQEG